MEIAKEKKLIIEDILLNLKKSSITGLCMSNCKDINNEVSVLKTKKYIQLGSKKKNSKKVKILDFSNLNFYTTTVREEINFYCKLNKVKDKKFKEEIEKEMVFLGLDISVLKRKIGTLSNKEKIKLYLLLNSIFDFDYIILKDLFRGVDKINYNIYLSLIKRWKDIKKGIVIIDDINVLYSIADYIILLKKNKILLNDDSKSVLNNVEFLISNDFEVPYLSKLTYLAKVKKGIKLFYQNDVRDVIKDVYKHVK